jgi:hypothetical protein
MKSFDNTIQFVLLELVVGAVFLLAILVAVPMLHDRVDSMSAIGVVVSTDTNSVKYMKAQEERKAALLALDAIVKRVDRLLEANRAGVVGGSSQTANIDSQSDLEGILEERLQPILTRFDELDREIESHFLTVADLSEVGSNSASALNDKDDDLLPMFVELNKRADSLLSEHENNILPSLIRLNDNIDLLLQESKRASLANKNLPSTTVVPVLKKAANSKVLHSIQAVLKEFQIESQIGPGGGSLLLSNFFDFNRFATTLNDKQVSGLSRLANALAKILPCYAKPATGDVVEKCGVEPSNIGMDAMMVQSFSHGGNVGTLRINYNSNLANARSIYVLKILLTARPDLLKYFNAKGSPLFIAVGKLALTQDVRSRRIVLQFIMEDNQGVVGLAN